MTNQEGRSDSSASDEHWWRASAYEVVDVPVYVPDRLRHIRPASGAEITPWQPWRDRAALLVAARDLIGIVDRYVPYEGPTDLDGAARPCLDWACRWGLLGVGLVGLRKVVQHPRYVGVRSAQTVFVRVGGGWSGSTDFGRRQPGAVTDSVVAVDTESEDTWESADRRANANLGVWEKPCAVYMDLDGDHVVPVGALSTFFPAVSADEVAESRRQPINLAGVGLLRRSLPDFKDQWEYPCPTDLDWWTGYAETPATMLMGATVGGHNLPGAQDIRAMWNGITSTAGDPDPFMNDQRRRGFAFARRLMADVQVVPTDNGLMVEAPTMLAALARVLFDDAVGSKTLRHCEVCKGLLIASRKDEVVCSTRCGSTQRQRRRRADPTTMASKVTALWKAKPPGEEPMATFARIAGEVGLGKRTDTVKALLRTNGYGDRNPSPKPAPHPPKRRRPPS